MEAEQQYDPEKLALLIEKQAKDILKNLRSLLLLTITIRYLLTKRSICRMATCTSVGQRRLSIQGTEALQQMAIITAAIGGRES